MVVRQDGRLEWEPGENRCIHVPPPGLAAALAAAKQQVAAEEAAGGSNGGSRRPPTPPGRRLSPAEVYERQEAAGEQLEPWQQVAADEAAAQLAAAAAEMGKVSSTAAAAHQQRNELQQQRLAALTGNSSNGNGAKPPGSAAAVTPPAVPDSKRPANVPADWREVKFSTMYKAEFGTFLKVVGGPEQLGAWEVEGAPPLQWAEGDVWSITLLLPPGRHEFKVRESERGRLGGSVCVCQEDGKGGREGEERQGALEHVGTCNKQVMCASK